MEKNPDQKEKTGKRKTKNHELTVITYAFLGMFLCLMGYFAYFQFEESEQFINNPYNRRQELFTQRVVRGTIYSADGVTLAETVTDAEGNEMRKYPNGRIFAHVVGYSDHGRTGIESLANFSLLRSNIFYVEKAVSDLQGEKSPGDSVTTTLDYSLQLRAFDALGRYDGAVVVMEPETGKLLAMVSKPDFDPNTIDEDWEELTAEDAEEDSVLVNRATQGLYPPGSTFKIFTTLAYMHQNPEMYSDFSFQCSGSYTEGHKTIHCHSNKAHGNEDLREAFANSCNSAYASIGLSLDIAQFGMLCDTMLFGTALPTSLEYSQSSFVLDAGDDISAVMETSIGQGKTLVTPFHMALITCAIANDGVLMQPYVIDHITDAEGNPVAQYLPGEYGMLLTEEDASVLQSYMRYVVESGTAKSLASDLYEAAGKTGSAEFSSNTDASHSWFVGYAHQEGGRPDIAVAVIVENSGIGSEYAVPIAKEIFDAYYYMDEE